MSNNVFGFDTALRYLKADARVQRLGWNGIGMWIMLVKNPHFYEFEGLGTYPVLPFIIMKTADNKIVPWLASQTDLLAEDWALYPA